jgi:hypothetical protein
MQTEREAAGEVCQQPRRKSYCDKGRDTVGKPQV